MKDKAIRDLVATLETVRVGAKPYGTVAIAKATIDETEDPAAVAAWIEANDGKLLDKEPIRPKGIAPGRTGARFKSVPPYYLLRKSLLEGPDAVPKPRVT